MSHDWEFGISFTAAFHVWRSRFFLESRIRVLTARGVDTGMAIGYKSIHVPRLGTVKIRETRHPREIVEA